MRIATREVEIGVGTPDVAPGRYAELIVADTGCGMNEDLKANIFEPFFTTKEVGKGTGLGLSISQRIVRDHDGALEATSAGKGKGSTFRLRLPTSAPAESARAA